MGFQEWMIKDYDSPPGHAAIYNRFDMEKAYKAGAQSVNKNIPDKMYVWRKGHEFATTSRPPNAFETSIGWSLHHIFEVEDV